MNLPAVLQVLRMPVHCYGSLVYLNDEGEESQVDLQDTLTYKRVVRLNHNDLLAKWRVGQRRRGFDTEVDVIAAARRWASEANVTKLVIGRLVNRTVIRGIEARRAMEAHDSLPGWPEPPLEPILGEWYRLPCE